MKQKNNADRVVIWGIDTPRRKFLYVDDMADASVHVWNAIGMSTTRTQSPCKATSR
ncbi:MAG: NAD-dependent epimerase/dehydratase family protein [Thiotrichales bacterium]|nr:NAD-dependent epimerase/dehydratase family protein [Thiotrichales bacterium]